MFMYSCVFSPCLAVTSHILPCSIHLLITYMRIYKPSTYCILLRLSCQHVCIVLSSSPAFKPAPNRISRQELYPHPGILQLQPPRSLETTRFPQDGKSNGMRTRVLSTTQIPGQGRADGIPPPWSELHMNNTSQEE